MLISLLSRNGDQVFLDSNSIFKNFPRILDKYICFSFRYNCNLVPSHSLHKEDKHQKPKVRQCHNRIRREEKCFNNESLFGRNHLSFPRKEI